MMKGLLIKDLRLMATQFAFFLLMPVIGVMIAVPTGDMEIGFSYITAISGVIGVTTINFDSYDNGFVYLFTLPISRRGYVKEKYVFAMLSSAVVMITVGLFMWALMVVANPGNRYILTDFLKDIETCYMIFLTVIALMLPVFFEFGSERSRFVILFIGLIFISVTIVSPVDIFQDIEIGGENGMKVITPVLCLVWLYVSYLISVKIMERKEF